MKSHEHYILHTIEVAKASSTAGSLPYGAVLVDEHGEILLEGKNTVLTAPDLIGHAEINLIQEASKRYDLSFLKNCTIYSSDEPCPMCASAIYWAGINRLVFGLSKSRFYDEFGRDNPDWDFNLDSRTILTSGGRQAEVIGPILEEQVLNVHRKQVLDEQAS